MFKSEVRPTGHLSLNVIRSTPQGPGLLWRLANILRLSFIMGFIAYHLAPTISKIFGFLIVTSRLSLQVKRADGTIIDYGPVCYRLVTDTGVAFIVDAFQNLVELENMKYHGLGTGTTAEAASQTGLITELTTQYNPDNTRATGSTTEGAANIYRTVGTVTPDAAVAITEHGVFSQAATGGGVMIDRSVFAAVNLNGTGDALQCTYDLTLNSGG